MTNTLLLGIHNKDLTFFYKMKAIQKGYSVILASSPEHFLANAKAVSASAYLFDLNFGKPGAQDISFARDAYSIISKKQMKDTTEQKIKVTGISALPIVVEMATQEKIPAKETDQFDITQFLS